MKAKFLSLLLVFAGFSSVFSQNYLYVINPDQPWYSPTATIEEAVLSVEPHGLFLEYGLYLTFSARGTNFDPEVQLEIWYDFTLPEGAIVTDSWLWVYDEISRAILLDKWTASSIYEEIVDRRRDPSILTQLSETGYRLQVYPMKPGETRKVKITFLVPMDLNKEQAYSFIPYDMLNSSKYPIPHIEMIVWPEETLGKPFILNREANQFQELEDEEGKEYYFAQVPFDSDLRQARLTFNTPLVDGIFLGTFAEDIDDGYYQLAVLPETFLDSYRSKKILFLLDRENVNTTVSKEELVASLKNALLDQMVPTDSFNIMVSNFDINAFSPGWEPATSANIESACAFALDKLASYSTLVPLLHRGLQFVLEEGEDGVVCLISAADQCGDAGTANEIIGDLLDFMPEPVPVHVIDFQTRDFAYHWIGNRSYYGNEYFYYNLSHLTHGSYVRSGTGLPTPLSQLLDQSLNEMNGIIEYFELGTRLGEGYTYARLNLTDDIAPFVSDPVIQVGRYHGQMPFELEMYGSWGGDFFGTQQVIETPAIQVLDSVTNQVWGGLHVQDIQEHGNPSNALITQVIGQSLEHRVLSYFTAFLCLEDSVQFCANCHDETELVNTEPPTEIKTDSLFMVFPNPFDQEITIRFFHIDPEEEFLTSYQLFDGTGKRIQNFYPEFTSGTDYVDIRWSPEEQGVGGSFFVLVAQGPFGVRSERLIRITE